MQIEPFGLLIDHDWPVDHDDDDVLKSFVKSPTRM